MPTTVDFAARLIDPGAIKAAGHTGVMCYVSPSRPGSNFGAKPITRLYADQCHQAGLETVSIWQFGKPNNPSAPSDYLSGFEGGQRMGLEARDRHFAAGGPGWCPIFFAVDDDINEDEWNNRAVHFFRGVNDAIGVEWTGIYGHDEVCAWAIRDGVIGRSTTPGKYWAWQTKAWSEGTITDGIVLYQRIVDTPSNPGPRIDGSSVDVNDIFAADYGQWSIPRGGNVATAPPMVEEDQTDNSPNSSNRFGARVRLNVKHTQEGNGTAQGLTNFLKNPNSGVSYHYACDNDHCIAVVDTDRASWSVLDANGVATNFCYAGSRASQSRQEWLDRFGRAIDMDAWLCVRDGRKYGIDPRTLNWDELRAGQSGCTDHYGITKGLGIGNHTDCGPNYPWDYFIERLNFHAAGVSPAPIPVVNEIDEKAKVSGWLGNRLTQGEVTTPDGRGRRTEFENGQIFWAPGLGAHPIPNNLFETYAELGWEAGALGYPTNDHSVLKDPSGVDWGDVQGFERGVLYRRYGQPGYFVHGEIGNRWFRSGFENGPLGWPVSNEEPFDTGAVQHFERGRIFWTPKATLALSTVDGPDKPLEDR